VPRAPTLAETLLRESLTGRELLRLPMHTPALLRAPRGDGGPVLLVPGLGATDASLLPLRRFLERLGHDPHGLQLGRMTADVRGTMPHVLARIRQLQQRSGRKLAVVGQSIGGVLAREAAREEPALVRRIVTFGSPVVGGPEHTATSVYYTAAERERIRARVAERARVPIVVPVTAIWSRNDGIVAPAACIDHATPAVEHVEVTSSHLGMGFDPDVWMIVARRLAGAT
jgi:hypothetical protein